MQRIESLFSLSLHSVLIQTILPDCIVVVDDNIEDDICSQIDYRVKRLNDSRVHYIRNNRTKGMSGTGAWNTGLEFLKNEIGEENYVAILDDDDSWDADYVENLYTYIMRDPDAVFACLKRSDCPKPSSFTREELQINNFLIGNPGIQGSNMCFKIKSIMAIGGFDENLASCTDRDLMIRFLHQYGNENCTIIPKKLVNHFAGTNTVTSNYEKKRVGLNYFFRKHIKRYDYQTLEQSLKRAEKLFHFPDADEIKSIWKQNTVVLITGVCGFIGSNVARKFLQSGYMVVGVDDLSTGVLENIADLMDNNQFIFYKASVNDAVIMKNSIDKYRPDYIFHFAALPRIKYSIDYPSASYNANVKATKVLAEIVKNANARLLVFASSSSVYGQSDGTKFKESASLAPISPYAKQKEEAENVLKEELKNSSCNVLVLRLFNVYGYSFQPVNKYSTLIGKQIANIYADSSIVIHGDGMQRRDFTYIDDVVSAMLNCIERYKCNKHYEVINIGTGNNFSVNYIADILQSHFKQNIVRRTITLDYQEPDYTLAGNQKANQLLGWIPETDIHSGIEKTITKTIENQEIVIGVAMHNNAPTIRRCLLSILNQQDVTRKIKIVLANDNSSDNWQEEVTDLLGDSRLTIIHLSNNNAVLTRNAINTYIQEHHPRCVLIGRLDADDEYSSDNELAKIEVIFDTECPDIISSGNYLRENGMIISRTNHTDKRFANMDYLLFRLKQMAECLPEGELPSCNLFIKPDKILPYPSVESGEDHALFVHYLLNKDRYKIHFAENLLPVIYDLGGKATSNNKFSGNYIRCRKELFLNALVYAR